MLKDLLKRTLDIWCRMRWLKSIDKQWKKCRKYESISKKYKSKADRHLKVANELHKRYTEIYSKGEENG